jgi:nicotinamidase-related amidase
VSTPHTAPLFASAALVTIDVQRDVLDGQPLEISGTSAALAAMRELTDAFRVAARPIVHIVRIYEADGSNVDPCRREAVKDGARMLLADAPGTEIARELLADEARLETERLLAGKVQTIGPDEFIIYKPRWGAFYQTPLEDHLREREISTIVFAGANFPNCPRTSIYQASERDFRVVAVADGISGLYEQGERELEAIGVSLMSAAEVCEQLRLVKVA